MYSIFICEKKNLYVKKNSEFFSYMKNISHVNKKKFNMYYLSNLLIKI